MTKQQLATVAIHAGEMHNDKGAHLAPIYQSSTFTFPDLAAVEAYAGGEADAYIYGRGAHPNRKILAAKLASLEGQQLIQAARDAGDDGPAVGAEIFSSGMAAISAALLGVAQAGDHVITQGALYGSADHLISEILPRYGITVSRVDDMDPEALARELEIRPTTKAVYLETPANPTMMLVDITAVSRIAHDHGAKVIVDNTFATPVLQRPLELGADVVVHSTTKYISGHGTSIGGAVVCSDVTLLEEKIGPLIRYLGGVPSPFDCWLTNLGMKTLPLRMERHSANGLAVAWFLEGHERVTAVHYPGLESFPQHALAKRQMEGYGGMIAFEVASGYEGARRILDRVELCSLAVSLGNVDTLIEHPASMTHKVLTQEHRDRMGIHDGFLRLSVGLEAPEDIISDLEQALDG